jgi:uncharacterized membrane protein YraQ (UPF0718 family)
MTFISSALPWYQVMLFPALLVLIGVLLFSTATLAFYLKQTLSFQHLRGLFLRYPGLLSNVLAVPLFLGMLEVEVPPGPAISFLLASPTINLGAIILLFLVFGWKYALFYMAVCLAAAIIVGWLIGRFPAARLLRTYLWFEEDEPEQGQRHLAFKKAVLLGGHLTRRFLPWLALATLAGILIDVCIPTNSVLSLGQWGIALGVPLAVLLGSVIYADVLLLIPIGFTLLQHGAQAPIVLTFMIAASGLSLPEMVVLSRILHPRPLLLFLAVTLCVYTLLGFGFALV